MLKKVVFVATRKPFAFAALIAATALSNCRPGRPTCHGVPSVRLMWTTQENAGCGLNLSSLRSRSKALVQR